MRKKIIAWFLLISIGISAAPLTGSAKKPKLQELLPEKKVQERVQKSERYERQENQTEPETKVIETEDFDSFVKASAMLAGGEAIEPDVGSQWESKRLLVKSENEFDPMGAESVIAGYGNLFVLQYASKEAAKAAYEALKEIRELTVEPDSIYGKTAKTAEKNTKSDELNQSVSLKNEGIASNGKETTVAVLDTGYSADDHTKERVSRGIDVTGSGTVCDANGHGTAMSDLILEYTPDCVSILPVKVADPNGYASVLTLYMGICYAIEQKADVINISMSSYKAVQSEILCEAIQKAKQAGIFVVVSAGNAGCDSKDFSPANAKDAIAVSAVTKKRHLADYSNYGAGISYCAYGTASLPGQNGERVLQEGTSVAAAFVSAAIAEKKAFNGGGSYDGLCRLLEQEAVDLGEAGRDPLYGMGLLLPETLKNAGQEIEEDTEYEKEKEGGLLFCNWKALPEEDLDERIGKATNMERRIFLDRLGKAEEELLLSKDTMFSREIVYSENTFYENGITKEKFRMEGTLFDIVKSQPFTQFEIQAQKYHIFAYGTNKGTKKSCIKLDTDANTSDATVYCWMVDHSSAQENSGEYGLTFDKGRSAYDFSACTSKIEECDSSDSGNQLVWRLKIRGVKADKPKDMAVHFKADLWNMDTYQRVGDVESGYGLHYWYIFHYQVKPASDAARQRAYGSGRYHGGFWDLKDAEGKKCGSTTVTTVLDIGTRDLYTDEDRDGIVYRLPLVEHAHTVTGTNVTDALATCLQKGSFHEEMTYSCEECRKTWTESGNIQEIPQLAHLYITKTEESNGIPDGKRWKECTRNCGGTDVNGEFWQGDARYLQPIRYWEMREDGTYAKQPTGTFKGYVYYAPGQRVGEWSRQPSEEFVTGRLPSFIAQDRASYHDVYIRRKQYTVKYYDVGAKTVCIHSQTAYCGQTISLLNNFISRSGYTFEGWSQEPGGEVLKGTTIKNLSLTDGATVALYAKWKPSVFKITLNNDGANLEPGTLFVYEKYGEGYYKDASAKEKFAGDKIVVPAKEIADASLMEGIRRLRFTGYYTKPGSKGYQVTDETGALISDINHSGNYQYYKNDGAAFAGWEDLYAVQFDPNLTEAEIRFLQTGQTGASGEKPVVCPYTRWKPMGEAITIGFGEAVVTNERFAAFYRFKGWSKTPEIKSDEEIILNERQRAYTFSADEDVTLYAQWDTSYAVAYVGNGQTGGLDVCDLSEQIASEYSFWKNPFEKTMEKPTVDIASGQEKKADGNPYTETIPFRFLGWSMARETDRQTAGRMYLEEEKTDGISLLLAAEEITGDGKGEGITFGSPAADYGKYPMQERNDPKPVQKLWEDERLPYLTMYAAWDEYPQILASDQYLPLADAQDGVLTEEYLLSLATAVDEELKSPQNPRGILKNGEDREHGTSFTILDYQTQDFVGAEQEMSLSITYEAKDQAGNVTEKMIKIHLADTSGKEYDAGNVRFISAGHLDTLAQDSVWRTDGYADALARALENRKTGEEYTTVTPVQRAFGVKSVLKPGSGSWEHVREVWSFTQEEIVKVQEYIKTAGIRGDSNEFLERFANCRVR